MDESVISIEDVDDVMRKGKEYVLNISQVDEHLQFIEDTVAELGR